MNELLKFEDLTMIEINIHYIEKLLKFQLSLSEMPNMSNINRAFNSLYKAIDFIKRTKYPEETERFIIDGVNVTQGFMHDFIKHKLNSKYGSKCTKFMYYDTDSLKEGK